MKLLHKHQQEHVMYYHESYKDTATVANHWNYLDLQLLSCD